MSCSQLQKVEKEFTPYTLVGQGWGAYNIIIEYSLILDTTMLFLSRRAM